MSERNEDLPSIPRLFGSDVRSRYLLSLLCDGPTHDAELARRIGVHRSHVLQLTQHFMALGVISKSGEKRFSTIGFNKRFIARQELLKVLYRIGYSRHRVRFGKPKLIDCDVVKPNLASFFGSPDRTIILALVGRIGRISIKDIASLAKLDHGSVRAVIAHFVNEGVFRCTRMPPHVYVELDERFLAARELNALVRKVSRELPVAQLVNLYLRKSGVMRKRAESISDPVKLVPIGTRTQAELLLALSRVGSIRVADLAIVVGRSQDAVRGVSESLVRAGFVVRETRKGGRNTERWLSLNTRHPLYNSLSSLLRHLAGDAKVPPLRRRSLKRASTEPLLPKPVKHVHLVGSDRSLDVICYVFEHPDC